MRRRSPRILMTLPLLTLSLTNDGFAQASRTRGVYEFHFLDDQWKKTEPPERRITSRTAVTIRIHHFNFLRYRLSYDVREEQVEAYQYLNKLWTSLLSPSLGSLVGVEALETTRPNLIRLCREVYADSLALEEEIAGVLSTYRKIGLTQTEAKALAGTQDGIVTKQNQLREKHAQLHAMIQDDNESFRQAFGALARYVETADRAFEGASEKASVFLDLSQRTLSIEENRLGTRKSGTRVTVTLTAVDPNGVEVDFEEVQYVVHSTMPLVLHGGVSFAGLDDVQFEKIQRAVEFSENDLFQVTSANQNTTDFSIFLSWQLVGWGGNRNTGDKDYKASLLVSLGTDVKDFGQRILIGPSAMLFGRFIVTGGWALGSEAKGEDATLEPSVFRLVSEETSSSFFFSIGVRLY